MAYQAEERNHNTPSVQIDAAICDLLMKINNFSDEDFDADCLEINESEVEALTVILIQILTKSITGYLLGRLLSGIRNKDEYNYYNKFILLLAENDSV